MRLLLQFPYRYYYNMKTRAVLLRKLIERRSHMPYPANTSDAVIDVSHYQGSSIDWPRVSAAGKTVAMIKACEGTSADDDFHVNAPAARAAGLFVIPYLFVTKDSPASQVSYFQSLVGITAGQAVALDWEGNGAPPSSLVEAVGMGLAAITNRAPLGYWGQFPPNIPTAAMQTWPRWIPRYGGNTGTPDLEHVPQAAWLFWQYTSNATVTGVTGNVDASLFAGTADELAQWCLDGTLPA